MKQEKKELLLKDLCSRLPYNVKCLVIFDDGTKEIMTPKTGLPNSFGRWDFDNENCSGCSNNFKPYLRPMSSMTEEEKEEWHNTFDSVQDYVPEADDYDDNWHEQPGIESYDWLNEHHFDYRGLIPKGLALEAKEGMHE